MTKISQFAEAQTAANQRVSTALEGLRADVASLNEKIAKLQGTAGEITDEDQRLLDDIQKTSAALADGLSALDAQTPGQEAGAAASPNQSPTPTPNAVTADNPTGGKMSEPGIQADVNPGNRGRTL